MHQNALLIFEKFAKQHFFPTANVLEIGPDLEMTYAKSVGESNYKDWTTADTLVRHTVSVVVDEYQLPMGWQDRFDIVLAGNVLEHVRAPWRWVLELERVCKPGGLVIIIAPSSWTYHESPVDCWRVYPEGMLALFEEARLSPVMAWNGCLECKRDERQIPGRGADFTGDQSLWVWVGDFSGDSGDEYQPVIECAFDTIGIGRKQVR